ncbi:TolC family protein [Pampinifervens florentissimum]|uniref:TolC family protein n=1 Tax=Pampinifervens florentissimum TaxID=1632019 RepID=UPI0013B48233|nr:TolC family protein [Hydrogenobacter sp. T-8]QID33187.1 TolC family protein [Hydrogenobacter sp. T-8]
MRIVVLLLTIFSLALAREVELKEAIELALRNSPLIKSAQKDLKAQELELKAAKGALFPRIKVEETFTRTDVPAYAFMSKLNQERITMQDFDPAKLNNPKAINNFETKFTLEVPIWLGGKVQSAQRMAEYEYRAVSLEAERRKEEVIRQVYNAYMDAVLAKESIKVAKQAVEDAKEHLRLAEQMHTVGMALLSDVLRARVYLSKAEENLQKAMRGYDIAKRGLEVVVGVPLGEFEVHDIGQCPEVDIKVLREKVQNRKDIKALEERVKTLEEAFRFTLSDNLPQVFAFAQYFLNSKDYPLGADGKGYLAGIGVSWTFDTGLTTLRRAQANLERRASLQERLKLLKDSAVFDLDRSYAEYENALDMLRSAEDRIRASQEVLRVMEVRYKNGLARMVDILDAQTELDRARIERVQAINACSKAYMDILYNAGSVEEVKR